MINQENDKENSQSIKKIENSPQINYMPLNIKKEDKSYLISNGKDEKPKQNNKSFQDIKLNNDEEEIMTTLHNLSNKNIQKNFNEDIECTIEERKEKIALQKEYVKIKKELKKTKKSKKNKNNKLNKVGNMFMYNDKKQNSLLASNDNINEKIYNNENIPLFSRLSQSFSNKNNNLEKVECDEFCSRSADKDPIEFTNENIEQKKFKVQEIQCIENKEELDDFNLIKNEDYICQNKIENDNKDAADLSKKREILSYGESITPNFTERDKLV